MTDDALVLTAIIEDHPLFRDAISMVVESMPELALGPVLADSDDVIAALDVSTPDLVVMDFSLESRDAPGLMASLRERWPRMRILVLSGHLRPDYAEASFDAGALGYVLKGHPDDFEKAIRAVLAGERFVSDAVFDE